MWWWRSIQRREREIRVTAGAILAWRLKRAEQLTLWPARRRSVRVGDPMAWRGQGGLAGE